MPPRRQARPPPVHKTTHTISSTNIVEEIDGVTYDIEIKRVETKLYYRRDGQTIDQNTIRRLQELNIRPNS